MHWFESVGGGEIFPKCCDKRKKKKNNMMKRDKEKEKNKFTLYIQDLSKVKDKYNNISVIIKIIQDMNKKSFSYFTKMHKQFNNA